MWLNLNGSNYPYLEQNFMVPKMSEPSRFGHTYLALLCASFALSSAAFASSWAFLASLSDLDLKRFDAYL